MTALTVLTSASDSVGILRETIERVKETHNENEVKDYLDKVTMARAWAKLKNQIDETRVVLLRLEIECLLKLYELRAGKLVPTFTHVMNFLNSWRNDIDGLLAHFPDAATARQLYQAHIRETRVKAGMDFASKGYRREKSKYEEKDGDYAVLTSAIDFQSEKQAIAFLLDRYASDGDEFTVPQMADDFITLVTEQGESVSEAFTEGIRAVCRKAVNQGGWEEMGKKKVPRFVTCYEEESQRIVRVPFENATLGQLKEMITIRGKALADFEAAFNNLKAIYNELAGNVPTGNDPDDYQIKNILGIS